MESDRIAAIRNWPTPTTVKEVQRFLGFAHYYRRFIQGFDVGDRELLAVIKALKALA